MGQTGSYLTKNFSKLTGSFSYSGSPLQDYDYDGADRAAAIFRGNPFVYSRQGSMYFDEDGDLAHEFYEEVAPRKRGGKRKMRRIHESNLRHQGEVKYKVPCLHVDFPIILYAD